MVALVTGGALAAIIGVVALIPDLPGQFANPPTDRESLERFGSQPVLTALESIASLLYAAAAIRFARNSDNEGDSFQMWLGIYSIVGAIAFLNYALFPTLYTELIYAGDIFLLASVLALLVGTAREIAAYQDAVAHAAVLDERRRFARDLHDGVAQELAFVASQIRWGARETPTQDEMEQILEAVERALDESRGAIAALSRPIDEALHIAIAHAAENVVERLGGRLELELEEAVEAPPMWREALTRIVREAVANAIRHGHARTIKVELSTSNGTTLRITDDGEGFDPSTPPSPTSFGLTSMKERAEALGGRFNVASQPGEGTTVEVALRPAVEAPGPRVPRTEEQDRPAVDPPVQIDR
jgi:signal transduction histidine kinase